MAKYSNKYDLVKATDEEINTFFREVKFTGFFDKDIPEEHKVSFCGKVTNIMMDGEQNNLCPQDLYVHQKYSSFIDDGNCEFICFVNLNSLRGEKHYYKLQIARIQNIIVKEVKSFNNDEEALFKRNLKLRNNLFVGQFTKNKDSSFSIRDIRRSDFSKLILQNGKEQQPIVYHPKDKKPINGKYYEFSWILNGVRKEEYAYLFKLDETKPLKEIAAYDIIDRLNKSIMDYSADAGQKIVKMLDTLKNQLTASGKEIFIYELLQNANDYPNIVNSTKEMVDVEFHITQDSLLFLHSGAEFNERNIAAICSINDKEKTDNKDTIGYKGIGFKTVFLDNNYVYLQTGDFSFRFDREETRDIVDTPWQILPIWTKFNELTSTQRYVFTKAEKKFRVKFALQPSNQKTLRESGQNYVKMFQNVFHNERVILFIPNLSSVKVYFNGKSEPDIVCLCDNERWQVDNFEDNIPEQITNLINSDINEQEDSGSLKIPTKYFDFTKTKVSFACEIDGNQLKVVENAQIYCYLPTKASWGFKFLMNTDMIPTGPRDDIEIDFSNQININAEISEISGRKFFDWIKSLCEIKRYKVNSIFSLIPVFDTNIKEHGKYKTLIERFKIGFDSKIETEELIPVGPDEYELVRNVILDETDLMSSGIMTDEDFFKITGYQGALPTKVLRNDREFKVFLKRYLKDFDCENNMWDFDELKNICSDPDFQEWIGKQENNNKFLEFLLKKKKLSDFLEEKIFIEETTGKLYEARNLYYNIDEHISDLHSFKEIMLHLSLATRKFFDGNLDWEKDIEDEFADFIPEDFVNDILLSSNEYKTTSQKLNIKDTSIHFYRFFAKNEIEINSDIKSLPFFDDNDELVNGFDSNILFFSPKYGRSVAAEDWLCNIDIKFVSPDYESDTLDYFRNYLDVKDFTDEIIVNSIIKSEDYHDDISDAIGENIETSISFVNYCYAQKELFENGNLRKFALHVYNCEGEEHWCLTEDKIFFPSALFDELSAKEWLSSDWLYALDNVYLDKQTDKTDYKKFLDQKFWVEELSDKVFYKEVIKTNLKEIIKYTSENNDINDHKNIDFVRYLDNNYQLIFEEEKDYDIFSEFSPLSTNCSFLSLDENLYAYDEKLEEILKKSWFPKNAVYLCSKEYGKSKALLTIGCKEYKFSEFYDDIIISELDSINECIEDKETSISFHTFIIEHLGSLTADQQSKMVNAKVYLYGNDEAAETSCGHKIFSTKAKELSDKELVEFSDLDIIDPDYKPENNVEYWETRLGNTKFTVNHFFSWLKDNIEYFRETLQDEDLNIKFWRWLKENVSDKLVTETPRLPIILKNGDIDCSDAPIYFSDEYLSGAGIEHSVLIFDKNALFISPKYLSENEDIDEWVTFWEHRGVKFEIVDILIETVIPNLSTIDDKNLPRLLAENRETLEKRFEDGLIPQLTDIRIKAHDGMYYSIDETIYIDCEKAEPFPYIKLPNQISFQTADERRLIKDIIDEVAGDCVSTQSEWQQRKLDCYLTMQGNENKSIRDFHYQYIDDLSVIRNNEREALNEIERIEKIHLLNKDNEFCEASSLTMGSVYNPFYDFEACGIESLDYVSDSYDKECSEYVGKFFRAIHIHCDFQEGDISFLTERDCSIYFWSQYLKKKDTYISKVKAFITDNLLDDLACIPTKIYMKTPKELYHGKEVSRYVKAIEDYENKIPLLELPEIITSNETSLFDELPFKESLDFLDALNALIIIIGQDKRAQLLEWMIEGYDDSYEDKILEYRESERALWYNNKNERVQIKDLYALDYNNKTLEQYFGTNARIINKAYLPAGDSFKETCDILKIKTITEDDLTMEPVGDTIYKVRDNDLRLFALVIAGISDNDNWSNLYHGYCKKLDLLSLHKCKFITITYTEDEDICQSLRKFYHKESSNDFYFVDSLDGKRVYSQFVKEYIDFIGINDVTEEVVEEIMDSRENAISLIKEQNALMLDEVFKNELNNLMPGIISSLSGNNAEEDDLTGMDSRPFFKNKSEENYLEDYDKVEKDTELHNYPEEDETLGPNERTIENKPYNNTSNVKTEDQTLKVKSEDPYEYDNDSSTETETEGFDESNDNNLGIKLLGERTIRPFTRKNPRPYTKEEVERLRSICSPLELESFPATEEEMNILSQCGISPEQIADTNYLAQLRLYKNLTDNMGEDPEESLEDFIKNANDISTHKLKNGKFIHACSAARGVMYVSPSLWAKMVDDKWSICIYLDGKGKNFHFINSAEDFLTLVEKDDVVIKITGKEKVNVVNNLYSGVLEGVTGTAYTLIRVAARTNMDNVFAHYVGAMAEREDGNDDSNDYSND